jgi:hypothetical protein
MAETSYVSLLLLILTNRSRVLKKNSNSSYHFPLPLHSKKTAGEIRQSSFMESGNDIYFLFKTLKASMRLSVIGIKVKLKADLNFSAE